MTIYTAISANTANHPGIISLAEEFGGTGEVKGARSVSVDVPMERSRDFEIAMRGYMSVGVALRGGAQIAPPEA